MALEVTTKDCTALSDSELAEMADICADGGHCYEVGTLSTAPENHQRMTERRLHKVANVGQDVPDPELFGDAGGELAVVSWGGTYGTVRTAIETARSQGKSASHIHLRWINPLPRTLGDMLKRFKRVLVCELNTGQMQFVIRSNYLIDAVGLNKVQGRPFMVGEILARIDEICGGKR